MNRNKRRETQRVQDKYKKAADKLTPVQLELIDRLAESKANDLVNNIANTITDCFFSAMRENRISEERANHILDRCKELIKEEELKGDKNGI